MLVKKTIILLLLTSSFSYGQVVAGTNNSSSNTVTPFEFFLIDIEPDNFAIDLSPTSPSEAGESIVFSTNTEKWINYTSSVPLGETRSVSVSATGLVPGINMSVLAAACSGCTGSSGTPSGALILSATPQSLITAIGGVFTGDGLNSGHNITYSISVSNLSLVSAANNNVTVIYTITDL